MKKKLVSIFLCVSLALGLVGCGFIDGFKDGAGKAKQENRKTN
ncbi:hypothetical protein [Clostridium hydrogeniformans]|nr:hypothetical protein [Clostridium hydrogeniformans]